jgi:leucyl aminopeptidase
MIKVEFSEKREAEKVDLLIIPLFQGEGDHDFLTQLDEEICGAIAYNLDHAGFKGQLDEQCAMTTNGMHAIAKIVCYGIGKREELTPLKFQEIGGKLVSLLTNVSSVFVDATHLSEQAVDLAFGALLKSWNFDKYCTMQIQKEKKLNVICKDEKEARLIFAKQQALVKGVHLARELISEPANVLYPEAFAKRCFALNAYGLDVEIYDKASLERMGAHAILAVGQGSTHAPYIVTLKWNGALAPQRPLALVGKGVCYDSGGINIKSSHLKEMKWDKAGAGAVVGTLVTAALQKLPLNIIGVIGLVENMPSGSSYKPGDVIKTLSGKTVEIVDTDNEGRVVLADCITLAQRFSPDYLIDLGTLTLETFGALAGEYAGLFSNQESLVRELLFAGDQSGEKVWRLPLGECFAKQNHSKIADLKNMGILGFGESSAAAEFLKAFVLPTTQWAHLDIAGVAWTEEATPLCQIGVTGFGVRLLIDWLNQRTNKTFIESLSIDDYILK